MRLGRERISKLSTAEGMEENAKWEVSMGPGTLGKGWPDPERQWIAFKH